MILLGFGANRFTSSAAEGYFGYVIRVGVRLLFLYLVLGVGLQIASQWNATLTSACNPVPTTLPWWTTYSVPPSSIITTVCSNVVPARLMLDLVALSVLFLIVTLAVPFTAASVAGGTIGLALSHAFEAAFIAQTVIRPITSALQNGFKIADRLGHVASDRDNGDAWLNTVRPTQVTQRLGNNDAKTNQRVPPPNRQVTSLIPTRAPKTTPIDPATGGLGNGKTMTVGDDKTTKRL